MYCKTVVLLRRSASSSLNSPLSTAIKVIRLINYAAQLLCLLFFFIVIKYLNFQPLVNNKL